MTSHDLNNFTKIMYKGNDKNNCTLSLIVTGMFCGLVVIVYPYVYTLGNRR